MQAFEEWIAEEIRTFAAEDPGNRLDKLDGSLIFDEPLVGFVSGVDPIFERLKDVIGPFHLTPIEALAKVSEQRGVPRSFDGGAGVVSFVLPISRATKKDNARMKEHPTAAWAHTRLAGEAFNKKLQAHVVSVLEEHGHFAVAPELEPGLFKVVRDPNVGFASPWSQRHVAYSANLGTFGLCDGLITTAGKAHRAGSVVVDVALDSPERSEDIHRDCLFYQDQKCMGCIERCPAGAITEDGHDKDKCGKYVFEQIPFIKEHYGIDIYGCGLCQVGVPCADGIPELSLPRIHTA